MPDNRKVSRVIVWISFVIYIGILVYFLFFAELLGRTDISYSYRYNLKPFKEINRFIMYYSQLGSWTVFLNLGGNVMAFIPFGMYIPVISRKKRGLLVTILITFLLTLSIELTQLVMKVGSFDVDDIILNTIGGIIGYLCISLVRLIKRKNTKK